MARIYVSSTYEDLKEHRDAVSKVLRKMKHEVVGMEDYAAGEERPLETCEADARGADIYVGLFAWRYGYIPREGNGRSITALEYAAAGEAGVPRLIFLLSEKAPWPSVHMDAQRDGADGEKIKALRSTLKTSHMIAEFQSPHELAAAVAAAVSLQASSLARRDVGRRLELAARYELGQSAVMMIVPVLRDATHAKVLELDFGAAAWWSTRLHLVVLVASDETDIEVLVFLDSDHVVGVASLRALRRALRSVHPEVESVYHEERGKLVPAGPMAAADPLENLLVQVGDRLRNLPLGEEAIAATIDLAWLRATLGSELTTETASAPGGPKKELDLAEILSKKSRFVPLVNPDGTLERVVDGHLLAVQVATGA